MCLGIPGKITEVYEANGLRMGKVDFGGVTREACLAYVPEVEVGDYTVIHVGFAISQLSEEEAMETLKLLNEIEDLAEELGEEPQIPQMSTEETQRASEEAQSYAEQKEESPLQKNLRGSA